jgi:hypothetical protein
MDPSPLPKNRRLTGQDLKARTRPMTPAQAQAARGRLEAFINALIEASISALTGEEPGAYDGCTGLDATPVPLFSRGPSKRAGLCASDPGGGWYAREGDHRDREDDKGRTLRKICWALEATITTMARPPGAPPATPNLAIGMAMARPGEDPGGTGARVLASVAARGHKTGWLGYDRAWYCPALPGPLITATTGLRDHAINRDLYDQQIAARAVYQLKRKDGPDADGYQRLSCPATGKHPGLICPLRQASLSPRDGRAKVLQPPAEPPRICRQTAITIAPDIGARYRQDLPYGSPAWHKTYATLRNTIEGLNGYAKDPAHEALAQPARRRVRGIAAQSIFTALLLMAANIRKIRAWRALTARDKARITRRARPPHQPARLPPRRLTGCSTHRHHQPGSPSRQPRPRPRKTLQPGRRHPVNTARQQPEPDIRLRGHNQKRPPDQFCRYDTGSSVGNPTCPRGDLNTRAREISPIEEIMRSA